MPLILRDRDTHILVSHINAVGNLDHIPAFVYTLAISDDGELVLEKNRKRFVVPERKYGYHKKFFHAVTKRYDRQNPSLGVLMHGQKGGGKSMLAEDVCNWGLNQDLPVLMVTRSISPAMIHAAVMIAGPCIVYFDEFGKNYADERLRNQLLSLFSDSSHQGALFIVTGNEVDEFSEYMVNRPGRFELRLFFPSLSLAIAKEIADDYHLTPVATELFLRHTFKHASSTDIALKVASVLRDAKTEDEIEAEISIMNVPDLAYFHYHLGEVHFRGELIYSDHLIVMMGKEPNTIHLTILDELKYPIHSQTIDTMDSAAVRLRTLQEERMYTGAPDDEDHLPTGRYSLTVTNELSIVFIRLVAESKPRSVLLDIGHLPKEKSLAVTVNQPNESPAITKFRQEIGSRDQAAFENAANTLRFSCPIAKLPKALDTE